MSNSRPRDRTTNRPNDHRRLSSDNDIIDLTSPPPVPPPRSESPPKFFDLTLESDSSDDTPEQASMPQKGVTQYPSNVASVVKRSSTPVGDMAAQPTHSSSRRQTEISQPHLQNSTIKASPTHIRPLPKKTVPETPRPESKDENEEAPLARTPSRHSGSRTRTMKHSRPISDSAGLSNGNPKTSFTTQDESRDEIEVIRSNAMSGQNKSPSKRLRRNFDRITNSNSQHDTRDAGVFDPLPRQEAEDDAEDIDADMGSQDLLQSPNTSQEHSKSPVNQDSQETSINSSSPVFVRLKQRKTRKSLREQGENGSSQQEHDVLGQRTYERVQVTVSQLVETLRRFKQSMEESQALTTRWILHDTNQASLDRKPLFTDTTSPFASMDSFPIETDDSIESVSYWVNKAGKSGKSKVSVNAKHVESSGLPRVPRYTSHTILRRNLLTADDEKLRFIQQMPEFEYTPDGDQKLKQFVKDTQEMYNTVHFTSGREAEVADQLREYLDPWLEELHIGCDQDMLKRHILGADLDGAKSPIPLKRKQKFKILESLGGRLEDEDEATAQAFCNAFDKVFNTRVKSYDWSIKALLFSKERLDNMLQSEASKPSHISPKSSSAQRNQGTRLETYASLTCMICGAIACQTHGDYHLQRASLSSESSDYEDDDIPKDEENFEHSLLVLLHKDMMRRHNKRIAEGSIKEREEAIARFNDPCSDDCFKIEDLTLDDYRWVDNRLSEFLAALPEMLLSHTNPNNRSCHIAFAWDIPCLLIHDEIERYERNHGPPPQFIEPITQSRPKRPDWYDSKRKALKNDWVDLTKAHDHQRRTQANPCAHDGPCVNTCSCVEANILCESFCGCPDDCPRRFTGCACSSSGINCASESCICIQMNRECGPECVSCGAVHRIDPANRYNDALFASGCKNVDLQRGVSKALLMGESEIPGAGFGLFTGQPIKKGDFLGEYAGEIISTTEAERRGFTYDRKISSFLFDLNTDWVVDAARIGNKTRFINHASTEKEGLNCAAKIVLVNGEHRIKFNATRDIEVGTELLFDYGPTFAEKHGLNKRPVQMLKNNSSGYAKKGSMKARKSGGPRGGRGGSKTAKKSGTSKGPSPAEGEEPPLVLPPDDDEDDDDFRGPQDEEEDSDDELEQKRIARRRRQIMRPARYTR